MEISGNSKQEIRSGKNLFDGTISASNKRISTSDGGSYDATGYSISSYIEIDANTNYVMNKSYSSYYSYYDNNKKYIAGGELKNNQATYSKSNAKYIRFDFKTEDLNTIQLEKGITVTAYEKFGVSPSINYPSEVKDVGDNVNKFLLPETQKLNGITYINNGDGTFNISGTATSNAGFISWIPIEEIKNNTMYTLSANTIENIEFRFEEYTEKQGTWIKQYSKLGVTQTTNPITKTVVKGAGTYVRFAIVVSNGTTVNLTNVKVKLEEGSTATEYSPYGQGCITEVISNKNLLQNSNNSVTVYGITANIQSDDTIKVSGTSTSTNAVYLINVKKIKASLIKEGNYTISFKNKEIYNVSIRLRKNNGTTKTEIKNIYLDKINKIETFDLKSLLDSDTIQVELDIICYSKNEYNFILNLQLEQGTTATPYEPHQEQPYTIPTQQPMKSVGNIRDTFIKTNGKWYERHYIARKIFDGTEGWMFVDSNTRFAIKITEQRAKIDVRNSSSNLTECLSNRFVKAAQASVGKVNNRIAFSEWSGIQFLYLSKIKDSVAELKSYLAENETYVDYPLEIPLDLECTEEQSKVLEELTYATTYEGTTHIYSTDEISPKLKTTCGSEVVPIGHFIIQKPDSEEVKEKTTFTGYDYMSKFDVTYVDDEIYPIKLYDKLNNLCKQVGVELGTKEIINGDYEISGNPFTNNETCKTVLSNIAQLACGFAKIGRDNKLYIITLSNKENIVETLDADCYMDDFSKNDIWGEVNSLIIRLSQVEGENTTIQDEESIQKNGLTEITISDNYFLKDSAEREKVIQAIWENIKGLKYLPFSTTYYGFPYLDAGDMLKIVDTKDTKYVSYVFNHEFTYNGSFTGTLETKALTKTQTALKNTNNIKTKFRNVELKVDKINGNITSIIEKQTDTENKLTQAQQDIEGFTQKVFTKDEVTEKVNEIKHTIDNITLQQQTKGGGNLFFYAKEYWKGSTDNSTATLEEYTNTLIQQNNISDEGYLINKGVSIQSQVVKNGQYVISFNYYKLKADATGYVKINSTEYKLDGNVNTWTEKIIPVKITSNSIKIEIRSDTDASFYIADLMVAVGTEKSVWTQNANETRTDTVEIGKGIQVNSSTKNTYTRIDADGNRTFNSSTNERVAEMTDKGVYTKQLEVKEQAKINVLLIQQIGSQVWLTGLGG